MTVTDGKLGVDEIKKKKKKNPSLKVLPSPFGVAFRVHKLIQKKYADIGTNL